MPKSAKWSFLFNAHEKSEEKHNVKTHSPVPGKTKTVLFSVLFISGRLWKICFSPSSGVPGLGQKGQWSFLSPWVACLSANMKQKFEEKHCLKQCSLMCVCVCVLTVNVRVHLNGQKSIVCILVILGNLTLLRHLSSTSASPVVLNWSATVWWSLRSS